MYEAGKTGPYFVQPTWDSVGTLPGCPASYVLQRVEDSGVIRDLNSFEKRFVTFNESDGSVTLLANAEDEIALEGIWTFQVTKSTVYSQTSRPSSTVDFDVSWGLNCMLDKITSYPDMSDVEYLIGASGQVQNEVKVWSQYVSFCPV